MDSDNISGKRETVVIACANLDVLSVSSPVRFYKADRVHLICPKIPDDSLCEVRDKIVQDICWALKHDDVIKHNADTYDCNAMMKVMMGIIREESGEFKDIYINLSSGTSEFAVAAMSVCRRERSAILFSVRTLRYSHPGDIGELLFKDGFPGGYSEQTQDPVMVSKMDMDRSDSDLAICLRIMREMKLGERNLYFGEIIDRLKNEGIWDYVPDRRRGKTDDAQKERMHFKRRFLNPMLERGWIVESDMVRGKWDITPEGEAIIDVYHGLE